MVRAKFTVTKVVESKYANGDISFEVQLGAVINGSEENKKFFKWTPSASINLQTVNPEAGEQFEAGKEYYVDFTKVDNDISKHI